MYIHMYVPAVNPVKVAQDLLGVSPLLLAHYRHSPEELQNVHVNLSKVVQKALEQRGVLKVCVKGVMLCVWM